MQVDLGHILVVDDDAGYCTFIASVLARAGFATAEALTGEEARALAADRPACVLLDVLLPDVTGYELCRELRDQYGEELPIIFVTGERTEPADRVAGLLVGGDDYVLKPFDPDELIARVRRLIVRSAAVSNGVPRADTLQLTTREREVLGLLAEGFDQETIARELSISPKTVATHIQRVLSKLGVHSRAQAVALAHREGLVETLRSQPAPARA